MFLPGELHIPCGIAVLSSTGLEQKLEAALQVGSQEDFFPPSSHILGFCCSDPRPLCGAQAPRLTWGL